MKFFFAFCTFICVIASPAYANDKPNNGRAEAVGEFVGGMIGGVGGAILMSKAKMSPLESKSTEMISEKAMSSAGAAFGRKLDQHAVDNYKTGRGGANDPRYNSLSLFGL